MTIQERLRRSNFIMLVVPVLIAGMLLLIGLGVLLALLETIYLPRLGMTCRSCTIRGRSWNQRSNG